MKSRLTYILNSTPIIGTLLLRCFYLIKFKKEINLVKNKKGKQSNSPSIIHFSINRAASQHLKNILYSISHDNKLESVGIHDYSFVSNLPYLDGLTSSEMESYKHIFRETGYIYSVFGGFIENIDNFNKYRIILSIRDPRDILVSQYFSAAYSHSVPPQTSNKKLDFLEERKIARSISIDEFVVLKSQRLLNIYDKYYKHLWKKDNVTIIKYEDMLENYSDWLKHWTLQAGLDISMENKNKIIRDNLENGRKKENIFSHNRKGVAGDYKSKLSKNTIAILNSTFSEILSIYDYKF